MCTGGDCSLKERCYRHTAKPDYYQTYLTNPPLKDDGTCDYYWNNERYAKSKNKNTDDDDRPVSSVDSLD